MGGATLGEDPYQSDLVDPDAETASISDMMENQDYHPTFSGYHLELTESYYCSK